MIATNHVVTGSAFAALALPYAPVWVVLPAAFLLHFVLDALPHFGQTGEAHWHRGLARLRWLLPLDAGVAFLVLLGIFLIAPEQRLLIMAGGVACASPDLFQITRYLRFLQSGDAAPGNDWFSQFHVRIQWCERLWGKWVELAWFVVFAGVILVNIW